MANLNLEGWTTPPQKFEGLYKIADDLQRQGYMKDQKAAREQARRAASNKFIESTYDPKHLLTGTLEDPNITSGMMSLQDIAYQMAAAGADENMIRMSLSGKAKELSDYSEKAKVLGRQWKEVEPLLKTQKGIDMAKVKTEYENLAFRNADGKIKHPSEIDHEKNYIDEVLRTRPVFNNEGIQDFVTGSGKDTRRDKIQRTNAKGGSYMTDAELIAPNWMIPEKNAKGETIGFEPKFEYATGEGEKLMHNFNGTTAPVKMVTDEVFDTLKANAKAFILQEAREYAKLHGVDVSSPQVENFAKAIAYDELKNAAKTSTSIKDIVVEKENPAPRISVRVNAGGSGAGATNINDLFGRIQKTVLANGAKATRFNQLKADEQAYIKSVVGDEEGNDLFLKPDKDGNTQIFKVTKKNGEKLLIPSSENLVTSINYVGTNFKKQPGIKENREVLNQADKRGNTTPATKSSKKKINW